MMNKKQLQAYRAVWRLSNHQLMVNTTNQPEWDFELSDGQTFVVYSESNFFFNVEYSRWGYKSKRLFGGADYALFVFEQSVFMMPMTILLNLIADSQYIESRWFYKRYLKIRPHLIISSVHTKKLT